MVPLLKCPSPSFNQLVRAAHCLCAACRVRAMPVLLETKGAASFWKTSGRSCQQRLSGPLRACLVRAQPNQIKKAGPESAERRTGYIQH